MGLLKFQGAISMKKIICGAVLALSVFSSLSAFADWKEEKQVELRDYIEAFKDPSAVELQKNICNELQWTGITDVVLYDLIDQRLNEILTSRASLKNGERAETAARFANCLATSGMDKYIPTFQRMDKTQVMKLRKRVYASLERLGLYKKWNPIIADETQFRSDQPLQANRYANMLRSRDRLLRELALKKVRSDKIHVEYLPAHVDFKEERKAELQGYIDAFKDPSAVELQKDICNELQWKGIADAELYDLIEQNLNMTLQYVMKSEVVSKNDAETAAWFAKGLGASGMEKYLPTLRKMAALHGKSYLKMVRYAEDGLAMFDRYSKWNPVIADEKKFRADLPLQINRFANMLKSEDRELQLIAIKRIHYDYVYYEYLLDILRDKLLASYKQAESTPEMHEYLIWMVRALAGPGNPKYYDSLKEVEAETTNKWLKRNIGNFIEKYYNE
jgi:hypothetical protein